MEFCFLNRFKSKIAVPYGKFINYSITGCIQEISAGKVREGPEGLGLARLELAGPLGNIGYLSEYLWSESNLSKIPSSCESERRERVDYHYPP